MRSELKKLLKKVRNNISKEKIVNKLCCICDNDVVDFNSYRGGWKEAPPLMSALEMIGSDLDNFSCPLCGAHDRERHLFLYLDRLELLERIKGAEVLHFAPEKRLVKIIERLAPSHYVKADLFPTDPTIEKIDMTSISYDSESFDFVIANHILEHIPDDCKALSELYRVLKHGGIAILQTPFSSKIKSTFQDPGIDNDNSRLHAYGQEDHVRLYGLDIFDRFSSAGFQADIRTHESTLSDLDATIYGINSREPLFLYKKL